MFIQDILSVLQNRLELCSESNRKATFKSWIFNDKASCCASKLAEAGFIFVGTKQEPDCVKCFLCNKSLDCWDEDDDPWLEHQKHASHCSFAKMNKPEKAFTLAEFMDIRNELITSIVTNMLNEHFEQTNGELLEDIVQLLNSIK